MAFAAAACLADPNHAVSAEPNRVSLFDGQSLKGWTGNPEFWRVEDGTITGETTAEHPAVLEAAAHLPDATFVTVDSRGVVDSTAIEAAIRPDTKLISVMHVNNELGVIQPVREIARLSLM